MGKTGRRRLRSKGLVDDDVCPNSNVENDATNIDTLLESNKKRRNERKNISARAKHPRGNEEQCATRTHRRVIYQINALLQARVPTSAGIRRHRLHTFADMRFDFGIT